MKICHLSSVHTWNDTRIFYKECKSLSEAGHEVHFVVVNAPESICDGVHVHSVTAKSNSRLFRASVISYRILIKGLKIKPDVFHFHDPELIWVGMILKWKGYQVVFDIHENIREQILDKDWLPLRKWVSKAYYLADLLAVKFFKLVIANGASFDYYVRLGGDCTLVQNFPDIKILSQFAAIDRKANGILYVGGLTRVRGIFRMIDAMALLRQQGVPFHFHCVGPGDDGIMDEIGKYGNYNLAKDSITFYGRLPVDEAYGISLQCKAGILVNLPVGNYRNSYATKVLEYLAVGLPVVVSNFKFYDFIEREGLGILVDPTDPVKISNALKELLENDDESRQISKKGIELVRLKYSWDVEKENLLKLYKVIEQVQLKERKK